MNLDAYSRQLRLDVEVRPPDRVTLFCEHCSERKPHVLKAGYAYCACGRRPPRLAPEEGSR